MARGRTVRTPKKREQFLAELSLGKSVSAGARACAMSRQAAYEWRAADKEFARQWDEAIEEGTDLLEDVAKTEAVGGNTTLLIFLLKARRPDMYRERLGIDFANATPEQVEAAILAMAPQKLRGILAKLKGNNSKDQG